MAEGDADRLGERGAVRPDDPLKAEAEADALQQKLEQAEARIVELEVELTALRAEFDRVAMRAVIIFPGTGEPMIDALRRYAHALEGQVERLENPSKQQSKEKKP